MKVRINSQVYVYLLLAFSLSSVVIVIYLWRQNVGLNRRLELSVSSGHTIPYMYEGKELESFVARDVEGRNITVVDRGVGRNSLLFIFSPTCDRCEAGIAAWTEIYKRLSNHKSQIPIVALSTADSYTTVQYARQKKLPFPIVPFPSVVLQKKYGIDEVPVTVVVNELGKVIAVWNKPLDSGEIADIVETTCPDCLK